MKEVVQMDEVTISRAIIESFTAEFMDAMDVEVAIAGAGPSGMMAAYDLASAGIKTVVFEKNLRLGGGMPGGGMMFNRIVLQEEGREILGGFDVRTKKYADGYYTADALEAMSLIAARAIQAGTKVFNLVSVEDVMIREENRITGLVLNWTAVSMAGLHVDPLTTRTGVVIDATGHDCEVARIVERKIGAYLRTPTGRVMGEKSMWAERGETEIVENTREVYPGLVVAGMAANAVCGSPRMGAIFGGMLISGKRAAQVALGLLKNGDSV